MIFSHGLFFSLGLEQLGMLQPALLAADRVRLLRLGVWCRQEHSKWLTLAGGKGILSSPHRHFDSLPERGGDGGLGLDGSPLPTTGQS